MKVAVDSTKCQGHARCLAEGPDVYLLDDRGYNSKKIYDVPQAKRGALACPELAIAVVEEQH